MYLILDKIPYGGRCNFEQDMCGWTNVPGKSLTWIRESGTNNQTGLKSDHTYNNLTGNYNINEMPCKYACLN